MRNIILIDRPLKFFLLLESEESSDYFPVTLDVFFAGTLEPFFAIGTFLFCVTTSVFFQVHLMI